MSKPVLVLQAPLWTRSGYGDWGIALAKSLVRYDKFDIHVIPTRWGHCSKKNLDTEINDAEGKYLLSRILRGPLTKHPDVFMQVTIPNEFMMTPQGPGKFAKFNIGCTAGIETTVPRPEWLEGLNRMDLNIVTSQHAKDVFAHANYSKKLPDGKLEPLTVKSPMEVLFWGADTKTYMKTDVTVPTVEKTLADIKEDYAFLFVGQWTGGNIAGDRKAIGWLIKTFLEAFKDKKEPRPCLILKTSGATISVMDRYECIQKIKEVTDMTKKESPNAVLPNVYLLHGELSDVEMNALYNHKKVKVHVSFTHGEGFGHPLLLSTLSGKPLLSSHWSGHLDFLNSKLCQFFEGSLEPIPGEAVNDWFVKEAKWFNVDYKRAADKMKYYFEFYGEKILEDAEKLRIENSQKFSLESMDKAFHAILDKYVPKFPTETVINLPKLKKIELPKFINKSTTTKTYHSQYNQDKFLNEDVFKDVKDGVFVDIGAYDGVTCSNTYFFEKQLNWSGVCFEPIPSIFGKLTVNRQCEKIHGCAWAENTKKLFRVVEGESDMLSGLVDCYSYEHAERVQRDGKNIHDIEVECYDINEVLGKDPKYKNINLLSLDTEGGELSILKHWDFSKFDVQVILVENQYDPNPIRDFLKTKGYKLLTHIEIDDVFVKA